MEIAGNTPQAITPGTSGGAEGGQRRSREALAIETTLVRMCWE